MTGDQIQYVRSSGASLGQETVPFVRDCFDRFFRACPSLRGAFPPDLTGVHRAFAHDFAFVVMHASGLEWHFDSLEGMGWWYRRRGVGPDEAVALKHAFLDAFEAHVDPRWHEGLRERWGAVLDVWFGVSFGLGERSVLAQAA